MKTVVVNQSNYIPWKGYFDLIHDADVFVFYDDVQFTKNDWRNRNRIKTPRGTEWITIPAGRDLDRLICEVRLEDPVWQKRHWKTIEQNYRRAPHFARYRPFLEDVYLGRHWESLSDLNQHLVRAIATEYLGIRTEFRDSREFQATGSRVPRLLELLRRAGADRYVSGPSGRHYIDPADFAAAGIRLEFKDYAGYPEYSQFHPPFEHAVTVLDLLFHTGPEAPAYVWGWRAVQAPAAGQGVGES